MGGQLSKAVAGVAARDLAVQLGCAAVAIHQQTEVFYDFSASCTYVYLVIQSLFGQAPGGKPRMRASVNSGMVLIWASRLGSFLLQRILHDGKDSRFDKVRANPRVFLAYWLIQALWIFLTALPVYLLNCKQRQSEALLNGEQREQKLQITTRDKVGWAMWLTGFVTQVVADRQKSAFRARASSKGQFINEGLWSLAQHPNYGGEILMWSGIFTSCSSEFEGLELLSVGSPAFVAYLLTQVSGVPLLRQANLKKWGTDAAYQKYLSETPLLWPFMKMPTL